MTLSQITANLASTISVFTNKDRRFRVIVSIVAMIVLQAAFFFAVVWSSVSIWPQVAASAVVLGDALTKQAQGLPESEIYKLDELLMQDAQFVEALKVTMIVLAKLIAFIAASHIVFIMPCWFFAHNAVRQTSWKVLFKLFWLALIWITLIGLTFVLYSIASGSTQTFLPITSSNVTTTIMIAALIIITYFAHGTMACADQKFKKMFHSCITNANMLVPATVVNGLIIFVAGSFGTILFFNNPINPTFPLVLFIALLFPALAFTRIHLIWTLWQKQN